jgi:hypothetical protein
MKEIDRQVTNLLEEGILVESNSLWNSPILVVPSGLVQTESKNGIW